MPVKSPYARAVFAYGLIRTTLVLTGAQLDVYNHQTRTFESRPLMFTERLAATAIGTILTASTAPIFLSRDAYRLELFLRNRLHAEKPPAHPPSTIIGLILGSIV